MASLPCLQHTTADVHPSVPTLPPTHHTLVTLHNTHTQTLQQLSDSLGERHWMYSAALCSLAALHEAKGEYGQVWCVCVCVRWGGRVQ